MSDNLKILIKDKVLLKLRVTDKVPIDAIGNVTLIKGDKGDKGDAGNTGASAYDVAVNNGYIGTEEDWLATLRAIDGLSAYEVALNNGFIGTEIDWLATLKGEKGDDGANGSNGASGIDGSKIYTGAGVPIIGLGVIGDIYFNTSNWDIYQKVISWVLVGNIKGATGANGTNGTNGVGVPTGGTANQVLSKIDGTNYNTQWVTPSGGGGASDYLSVLTLAEIAVTTATTATINRQHLISGTVSDYTVTLPTASGNVGKFVGIRIDKNATRLFTIKGNGAELIDGSNTRIMWKCESAILYCDGVGWSKIGGVSVPMSCTIARSAVQNSISSGAAVAIQLNRIDSNNTGFMADTTNFRINIKRAGTYTVIGSVVWNGITSNTSRCLSQTEKTGATLSNSEVSALAGAYSSPVAVAETICTTSDYIKLLAFHNNGTTQSVWGIGSGASSYLTVSEKITW